MSQCHACLSNLNCWLYVPPIYIYICVHIHIHTHIHIHVHIHIHIPYDSHYYCLIIPILSPLTLFVKQSEICDLATKMAEKGQGFLWGVWGDIYFDDLAIKDDDFQWVPSGYLTVCHGIVGHRNRWFT